jgi:hypothetical protein
VFEVLEVKRDREQVPLLVELNRIELEDLVMDEPVDLVQRGGIVHLHLVQRTHGEAD